MNDNNVDRLPPPLDTVQANARTWDFGNLLHRPPASMFEPRTTEEVRALVRAARSAGHPVAARGMGHSAGGQAQAPGGWVLDLRQLRGVVDRCPEGTWVEVMAGTTWDACLRDLIPRGLTLPTVTDWLHLTVGGTVSLGGVGAHSFRNGLQADAVLALEVVLGDGTAVRCSREEAPELFDLARAGLGLFGVITRVRMRCVPAPNRVRVSHHFFPDFASMRQAIVSNLDNPNIDGLLAHGLAATKSGLHARFGDDGAALAPALAGTGNRSRWWFELEVTQTADAPTLDPFRGQAPHATLHKEHDYLGYVTRIPPIIALAETVGEGARPEIVLAVPNAAAKQWLPDMLEHEAHEDLGGGPILVVPLRRDRVRTPMFRLPDDDVVFLVGLLRNAAGRPEYHRERLRARNLKLYAQAVEQGCYRYPCDSLQMPDSAHGWSQHFGEQWPRMQQARRTFDPGGLFGSAYRVFDDPPAR